MQLGIQSQGKNEIFDEEIFSNKLWRILGKLIRCLNNDDAHELGILTTRIHFRHVEFMLVDVD